MYPAQHLRPGPFTMHTAPKLTTTAHPRQSLSKTIWNFEFDYGRCFCTKDILLSKGSQGRKAHEAGTMPTIQNRECPL